MLQEKFKNIPKAKYAHKSAPEEVTSFCSQATFKELAKVTRIRGNHYKKALANSQILLQSVFKGLYKHH
jgi:hypothetical protein